MRRSLAVQALAICSGWSTTEPTPEVKSRVGQRKGGETAPGDTGEVLHHEWLLDSIDQTAETLRGGIQQPGGHLVRRYGFPGLKT